MPETRTLRLAGLAAAVAGMASLGCAARGAPAVERDTISLNNPATGVQLRIRIERDDPTVATTIHATPQQVWEATEYVYNALGIELTYYEPERQRLGAQEWRARRIGGQRLSRWVDCGVGVGGRYADTWQVRLNVGSVVEAAGDGAIIYTRVDGYARSMDGSSANDQHCTSLGSLEVVITRAVRQVLQQSISG